jgi:hypothetical protein
MSPKPTRSLVIGAVLFIALAAGIAIAAMAVYKDSTRSAGNRSQTPGVSERRSDSPSGREMPVAACGLPLRPPTSSVAMERVRKHAQDLADRRIYDQALEYFRTVATEDSGFPGINLDTSLTLLQLKRPADAKKAVDAQLAMSDCLSKLPAEDLDRYCKSEGFVTTEKCNQTLQTISQRAHYQAALVQIQFAHAAGTEAAASIGQQIPQLAPRHLKAPRSLAEGTDASTEPPPAPTRNSRTKDLANGSGTDSDLGAYSKDPTH